MTKKNSLNVKNHLKSYENKNQYYSCAIVNFNWARNLGYTDLADNLLKSEPQEWTLEVFSATTGEKVFSQTVEGSSFTIDTTSWKPGVYVVRAVIGDEVLNEKVVVN